MNPNSACVIWLTGVSGAGKSTIADALMSQLKTIGTPVFPIDGDDLRDGLSSDLSFSAEDRLENMRRAAEIAKMTSARGLVTVVSLISPASAGRQMVRERIQHGRFVQVYVKTPVHLAEQRDVKGLYKQARAGLIKNFTGIGSDYEVPTDSEVVIDTSTVDPQAAAHQILEYIGQRDWSQDAQS